mgnify:CR=1 FL=1
MSPLFEMLDKLIDKYFLGSGTRSIRPENKVAKLIGNGPGIHHFGVEVEDREATIKKIQENGGEIFSDREEGALK